MIAAPGEPYFVPGNAWKIAEICDHRWYAADNKRCGLLYEKMLPGTQLEGPLSDCRTNCIILARIITKTSRRFGS